MIIPPPAIASLARCTGLAVALLCACCGPQLAAAQYDDEDDLDYQLDMKVNDVRFGVALLPANANITTKRNGDPSYDRRSIFESGGRTSLMWMAPLGKLDEDGGFLGGIELSTNRYKMAGSLYQPEIDCRCYVGTVHIGIGWMLSPRIHLETTLFGGYGTSSFTTKKYGVYWEYGARAGLFYTFRGGLQAGAHLSYLETRAEQTYTSGDDTYDILVKSRGGYGGVMVGMRF